MTGTRLRGLGNLASFGNLATTAFLVVCLANVARSVWKAGKDLARSPSSVLEYIDALAPIRKLLPDGAKASLVGDLAEVHELGGTPVDYLYLTQNAVVPRLVEKGPGDGRWVVGVFGSAAAADSWLATSGCRVVTSVDGRIFLAERRE